MFAAGLYIGAHLMAAKKAAPKAQKDEWMFDIDGDGCYTTYPSFEAALKEAKECAAEYSGSSRKSIKVKFYQLAKVSEFQFKIEEVPVMTRKVTVEVK